MSLSPHFPNPSLRIRFSVGSKDFIRRMDLQPPGPSGGGITIWHIYPTLANWLGKKVPDDVNPRSHGENVLKGSLPLGIEETLEEYSEDFYLANRGETILAKSVEFDPHTSTVEILLTEPHGDDAIHGIADGGTTDAVIAKVQREEAKGLDSGNLRDEEIPLCLQTARLHLEVIVGLEDRERIARLVQGRNTSRQVKPWTLADFKGNFDWVRDLLERKGGPFAGKVGYEENAIKSVNILEILCIMTLFHSEYDSKGKAPTVAYSSKGRMDKRLANDKLLPGYKALAPILEDILTLHDHVYSNFFAAYRKVKPKGRPGRRGTGDNRIFSSEEKITLSLTGGEASHRVPAGVLYPLLQSLRAIVDYGDDRQARWRMNPRKFFDRNAGELMDNLLGQLEVVGNNPNALGKTRTAYTALYDRARILAYDEERGGLDVSNRVQ